MCSSARIPLSLTPQPLQRRRARPATRKAQESVQQRPFTLCSLNPIVMPPYLPRQLVEVALPALFVNVLGLEPGNNGREQAALLLLHATNVAELGKDLGGQLR